MIHAIGNEWEMAFNRHVSRETINSALRMACGTGTVKVVSDPSIPQNEGNHSTWELVFTPMADCDRTWEIYRAAQQVCDDLGAYAPRPSGISSAGHHVHISRSALADGITAEQFTDASIAHMQNSRGYLQGSAWFADPMDAIAVKDIAIRYGENNINRFLPRSRRDAYYCKPMSSRTISQLKACTGGISALRACIGQGKYHVINLTDACWNDNKTIEFRQGGCTWSADKTKEWNRLLLNLVYSTRKDRVEEASQRTITTPARGSELFRANSRSAPQYDLMRNNNGGATTREIIEAMGGSEGDVRRRVSELRSRFAERNLPEAAIVTHTQQAQGQSYGSGTDHTRYEVLTQYITGNQARMMPENRRGPSTIFARMTDAEYEYWQDRAEALR